jgi:hypothetical protein
MSALEALVIAGKGLKAFSVLFLKAEKYVCYMPLAPARGSNFQQCGVSGDSSSTLAEGTNFTRQVSCLLFYFLSSSLRCCCCCCCSNMPLSILLQAAARPEIIDQNDIY